MLRRIGSVLATLCLGAIASVASATEVNLFTHVLRVHPLADGSIVLMMTTDSPSCTSTATPNKHYTIKVGQNGVSADGLRAMQATAMTAVATGYRLTIYFDDATSFCYVNRILMRE